jgi:hypothetical protein
LRNGEGFDSLPPRVSLAEMIERSRQLRCWFPSGLRRAEERWQAKTDVAFHLWDWERLYFHSATQ